jgi:hypothetical protein
LAIYLLSAGNLPALTAQAGVDYVTLDRDVAITGDVTRPPLDGNSRRPHRQWLRVMTAT